MSETPELAALEARVAVLEAAESIRRLKARYAALVDRRYRRGGGVVEAEELAGLATEIASLFCEDATWDGGKALGTCQGRAAIRERFLDPTLRFSLHYFLNADIEVDGDRAEARWDLLAPCTTRDDRAHWMTGIERDRYRRVDGRWLHSHMALEVIFMAPHDRGWTKG